MSNVNPTTDSTITSSPHGVFVGVDPATPALPVPVPVPVTVATTPAGFFTADQISAAREQEKNKLYPEMEKLKSQLQVLTQAEEAREAEKQRLAAEAAEQARQALEAETDVRTLLLQKEQEWEQRFVELQNTANQANLIALKERDYADLIQYKTERVAQAAEMIVPDLIDLVSGDTREEIDVSIARLAAKSASILEGVQAAQQQTRRDMPGTRVTTPSPVELNSGQHRQFTDAEIAAMPMHEYVKNRPNILSQKAQGQNQGIYGSSR